MMIILNVEFYILNADAVKKAGDTIIYRSGAGYW